MSEAEQPLAPREPEWRPVPLKVELDSATRWQLIRKALVFQLKLALDGIKDLVLSPMVLVALFFDLFRPSRETGRNLGKVFRAGLVFEEWLDLYAPARDPDVVAAGGEATPLAGGLDEKLGELEALVREQIERGQVSEKAKAAFDAMIGVDAKASSPSDDA